MKVSKNFIIQEFVSRNIYNRFGENSIWFVDPKIIQVAQFSREFFGKPIYINTWHLKRTPFNQEFNYSGFREPEYELGAKLSQHRFGRAIDIKIIKMDTMEIRKRIKDNYDEFRRIGLTTIEKDTLTWVHMDCRPLLKKELFEVSYVR